MILPSQQAASAGVLSLVQSTLDDIEKRRAEAEEKAKGKKEDKVLKARTERDAALQSANSKINEHFFNKGVVDINEMKVQLVDRLGEMLGLERGDDQSGYSYGRQLEDALADADPRAIEEALGLDDLGISLSELIAAIKNPFGEEDDKLEAALEEQAGGGPGTAVANSKVLQRLKQVADPKSLEELKLEKVEGTKDPTQVADAETAAERDDDIRSMEAMEKLDDVKKVQDAVSQRNEPASQSGQDPAARTGDDTTAAMETLTALAAAAETIETADTGSSADDAAPDDGESDTLDAPDGSIDEDEQIAFLAKIDQKVQDDSIKGILPIQVDENGIYEILTRKAKDQQAA